MIPSHFSGVNEMTEGYLDGMDLTSPQPSDNRTASYRHGFENGRDDRRGKPRDSCENLRLKANLAIEQDSWNSQK